MQALDGNWPKGANGRLKLGKLIPMFQTENELFIFNGKLCEPRKSLSTISDISEESRICGYINFARPY